MHVSVKNNSPAKQGVHTKAGVKWIKPGVAITIEIDDTRELERLPFLEVQFSDAGVPLGDLPAPPASLVAKVAPPAEDMPALRKAYQEKMGKRPFPGWPADELRRRMGDA